MEKESMAFSSSPKSATKNQTVNKSITMAILMLVLFITTHLYGASPKLLHFQGRLFDSLNNPIGGETTIAFSLYNQAAGGSLLWTETQTVTSNTEGVYSVLLGSVTVLNLDFDTQYYLGITISGETEMTPRFQLASAAYALNAVTSINNVKNGGGNINLVAGNNVTITQDDSANTITISTIATGGGITTIIGGNGIISSEDNGVVTLSADMAVVASKTHSHTITSAMIQDSTITTADLAFTPLTNGYSGDVTINGGLDLSAALDMNNYDINGVQDLEADDIEAEDLFLGFNYGTDGSPSDGNVYLRDGDGNETIHLDSDYNSGGAILLYNEAGGTTVKLNENDLGGNISMYDSTGYCTIQLMAGDNRNPNIRVNGSTVHDYADVFSFVSSANPQPGQVVSIATGGKLDISSSAYDLKVAGIVSGAGNLSPGMVVGGDDDDPHTAPIAVSGRVYCYVDATENAVETGDLLTTSRTAGYAMKVVDRELAFGAVLGKAMEPLPKGEKGLVLVLVCLN